MEGSFGNSTVKHSLQLSRHRRANVWMDEALPADFNASHFVTKMVEPKIATNARRRIAGLELYIPQGGKFSYALLGAELVSADVSGLEVIVSVNEAGVPFVDPLVGNDVSLGLLEEYADAVINGAATVAETVGAPSMEKLWFRWAAHSVVSSSRGAFEMLSGIVLRLLLLQDASSHEIRALLE
jgi:hypothetical protein